MRKYKNGDRCPCCGTEIRGKSEQWLEAFNEAVALCGFPFLPDPAPDSTGAADPPDRLVPTVMLDLMRDAWLEKLEAGND